MVSEVRARKREMGPMINWNSFDREEAQIEKDFEAGSISREERNKALMDLQREARDAAREEAEGAYERSMDDNGMGRW